MIPMQDDPATFKPLPKFIKAYSIFRTVEKGIRESSYFWVK
jgi:hypothetical protein